MEDVPLPSFGYISVGLMKRQQGEGLMKTSDFFLTADEYDIN